MAYMFDKKGRQRTKVAKTGWVEIEAPEQQGHKAGPDDGYGMVTKPVSQDDWLAALKEAWGKA